MDKKIHHISYENISGYLDISFENIEFFFTGTYKITLLGDIYTEKKRLIEKLKDSSSSIQVISHILKKVEGKFIIIKETPEALIIINDKLGLKPFYINQEDTSISFSNTLDTYTKKIETISLDKKNIVEFLEFGFLGGGKTLFQNLYNMDAGSIQVFHTSGKKENIPYYSLQKQVHPITVKDLGKVFQKGIQKRVLNTTHVQSFLSGGYDTRFILGNLISLGFTDKIHVYSAESASEDFMIAQDIAQHFNLSFHKIPKTDKKRYYRYSPIKKKENIFTGLGGGELLGNSMRESWFIKNDIQSCIKDFSLLSKKEYTKDIPSFIFEICRTSVNTVQGISWSNPNVFGMGGNLLPFFDTNFLECLISFNKKDLKGYNTYKKLYTEFFPEGENFDFTYCFERDGERNDVDLFASDTIITKNYHISKLEMKEILHISSRLYTKHQDYLNSFLDKNIIQRVPLEMLLILITLEKINIKNT